MNLATARARLEALKVVDMPCSTCHAAAGAKCHTTGGLELTEPHKPRERAFEEHRDELLKLIAWEDQ